jgi:CheY-like chemotaxis protein
VLVVDDNHDAADALAEVLGLLGCTTRACYDGAAALGAAAEFRPDACLLDLVMPGMDGYELAARLRAGAGSRPLLLVATTALGGAEDRARTAIAGFHYHLVKPVDTPTLFDALRRFGETAGRTARPPDPPESR